MNKLTKRQKQVAKLVCAGISNKQIGTLLGIAEGTVKIHLNTIYTKLGIQNRMMLAVQMVWNQR